MNLKRVATKYCKNPFLIKTVRPLWRFYEHLLHKHERYVFRKNAYSVLNHFAQACNNHGVKFWLEFGTLLGAYRENGFIPHDFDLDIGVMYDDVARLNEILLANGFKIIRKFEVQGNPGLGLEFTFKYKHIPIDIFVFHEKKEEGLIVCNSFSPIIGEEKFNGLSEVKEISFPMFKIVTYNFNNIEVGVPEDIPSHLELNYGKNYMIPDKNFDYRSTAGNVRYFSRDERLAKLYEF